LFAESLGERVDYSIRKTEIAMADSLLELRREAEAPRFVLEWGWARDFLGLSH
jgi:hypothetical protein